MTWRGATTVSDRIFASLPYLLALFYGLPFGDPLLTMFPVLGQLLGPLILPVTALYTMIPFAGIVIFMALLFLVVRNARVSHFIRFNTMQALLISLVLFLCQIVLFVLGSMGAVVSMAIIAKVLSNTVFLGVLAVFGYAVVQCFRGHYAEIPTLSEAAYMQVR